MKSNAINKEISIAKEYPVIEALYRLRRSRGNGLYDCLVPMLKARRKPKQIRHDLGDDSDARYFGDLIVDNDLLRHELEKQKA